MNLFLVLLLVFIWGEIDENRTVVDTFEHKYSHKYYENEYTNIAIIKYTSWKHKDSYVWCVTGVHNLASGTINEFQWLFSFHAIFCFSVIIWVLLCFFFSIRMFVAGFAAFEILLLLSDSPVWFINFTSTRFVFHLLEWVCFVL